MTKTCFKCMKSKPIDEFYKHPMMADGHLGKCKECAKADVHENYIRNRARYSEYERERFGRPERRAKLAGYLRTHRIRYPEKAAARTAVSNAIRTGRLIRPPCCGRCGNGGRIQAHHHDYGKPLEVEWMCFKCHREHGHGQVVTATF